MNAHENRRKSPEYIPSTLPFRRLSKAREELKSLILHYSGSAVYRKPALRASRRPLTRDEPAQPAPRSEHTQLKRERLFSFRLSISSLRLVSSCVGARRLARLSEAGGKKLENCSSERPDERERAMMRGRRVFRSRWPEQVRVPCRESRGGPAAWACALSSSASLRETALRRRRMLACEPCQAGERTAAIVKAQ
jgi:hypothetical protein